MGGTGCVFMIRLQDLMCLMDVSEKVKTSWSSRSKPTLCWSDGRSNNQAVSLRREKQLC